MICVVNHEIGFVFKQSTAYEMRISDWSSDVCSSDLVAIATHRLLASEVMEALIPGSTSAEGVEEAHPRQHAPVSIRGLTPGIAYNLGDCCHPVDRKSTRLNSSH